jgi:hypothetical protein
MHLRYSRSLIPRGAFSDAETGEGISLLKNVSALRLTYQIRLLTFRAVETGRKLIIEVPKESSIHPDLRDFLKDYPKNVRIEWV